MAILQNPFTFKDLNDNGRYYYCKCYTTEEEATPIKYGEGSCFKIKNNNNFCYVGLVLLSNKTLSPYSTPLTIKKNGNEYSVQMEVNNEYNVVITQSAHQTIKVVCNNIEYTSTFTIAAGTPYTIIVTPDNGYTAGSPNINSTGYVNTDLSITASPATNNSFLITIPSTQNQTITVKIYTNNSKTQLLGTYTSSFTANYGNYYEATVTQNEGYIAGTINPVNGTISSAFTFTVTEATIRKYTFTIVQPSSGNNIIKINGNQGSTFAINAGTSVEISIENTDNRDFDLYEVEVD